MKHNTSILKMGVILTLLVIGSVFFTGCNDQETPAPEDKTAKQTVDKHNAVEVNMTVTHFDGFDLLTTTKSVYDVQGNFIKTIQHLDTLPSLGLVSEKFDTGRTIENSDGDEVSVDTTVTHPRDYQLYITVTKK